MLFAERNESMSAPMTVIKEASHMDDDDTLAMLLANQAATDARDARDSRDTRGMWMVWGFLFIVFALIVLIWNRGKDGNGLGDVAAITALAGVTGNRGPPETESLRAEIGASETRTQSMIRDTALTQKLDTQHNSVQAQIGALTNVVHNGQLTNAQEIAGVKNLVLETSHKNEIATKDAEIMALKAQLSNMVNNNAVANNGLTPSFC
jgi:hypothetical protein